MGGTEEKSAPQFFSPFCRYVFCEYNVESITAVITRTENDNLGNVKDKPIEALNPKEAIQKFYKFLF